MTGSEDAKVIDLDARRDKQEEDKLVTLATEQLDYFRKQFAELKGGQDTTK